MSNQDRARDFIQLIATGEFETAKALLHDEFTFEGPFDTFDRPEPYFAALEQLHGIVAGVQIHRVFHEGDDVCVLYDLMTNSAAGAAFVAEWMRFRYGKIRSIRAVFDARPFAAMFETDAGTTAR
jgi:hypothetical protein